MVDKPKGWRGEPGRHSLAAKGIKTGRKSRPTNTLEHRQIKAFRKMKAMLPIPGHTTFLQTNVPYSEKWPPGGLSKEEWQLFLATKPFRKAGIQHVPIDRFETFQEWLVPETLEETTRRYSSISPPGKAIQIGNKFWIYDGNHRVAAGMLLGEESVRMKVIRLPEQL